VCRSDNTTHNLLKNNFQCATFTMCVVTAWVHCVCMGWISPTSDWHGSQTVSSRLRQGQNGYIEHSLPWKP